MTNLVEDLIHQLKNRMDLKKEQKISPRAQQSAVEEAFSLKDYRLFKWDDIRPRTHFYKVSIGNGKIVVSFHEVMDKEGNGCYISTPVGRRGFIHKENIDNNIPEKIRKQETPVIYLK